MKKNFPLIFVFILIIGTGCYPLNSISDADQAVVEGVVRDASGDPLPDIIVEIEGHQVETDQHGQFKFDNLQQGTYRIALKGENGTGRYEADFMQSGVLLDLVYPVRTTVVLLHDNDLHFNYNHKNAFMARVEEIRAGYENVWLLNAGDTFVRHAHRWAVDDTLYYMDRSRFMIENMNEAGYDLAVPGNHELDYVGIHSGQSLELAEFPFIAANIDIATGKVPLFKPFEVFNTKNGLSIAILGLSTVNFDKPGVSARDPVETAMAYSNLGSEYNLFVALTHIGYSQDEAVAEAVPEVDVIVGGHSHTLLEKAETLNGVLIAQAGGPPPQHQVDPEWPKYLGKIKVIFENETVVEKSGYVITIGDPVIAE